MPTQREQEKKNTQKDAGLAAEQRPVPSQAEGDEETIDQDLKQKEEPQKR